MVENELAEIKEQTEVQKWVADFLKAIDKDETDLLVQVKHERELWDEYVNGERDLIEADLILLRNQVKQKGKIWDTTLFNVHTAYVARSFHNKSPIKFKWDKNWIEREIKMLNSVWKEDSQTSYMKAIKYYEYFDKFATWICITAKVGWDWTYKRNIYQNINPLLAVPDPNGDYFTGNYRFIWFPTIKTKGQLEAEWYDTDDLQQWESVDWAIETKRTSQQDQWLNSVVDKDLFEVYLHFTTIQQEIDWDIVNRKIWALTGANEKIILNAWFIKAWNKHEEKNPESISFPLKFKYWKPLRDNFYWDRPANYTRDVQIQKAIIANLRLDKMRAELYPMYLYNKDYVSGKDLSFWFNKGIPISTWINWPQVNLQNLVSPVAKDLRIDTSITVDELMDRQVEKSTSIWAIASWTTPDKRETLWTNQLIVSNTDVNLNLNEEIDLIWEEQGVQIWFNWYYQNFSDADSKLIFAWMWTSQVPIQLKRKDFIYEWNLAISIESNAQSEIRKRKQAQAYLVTWPLILQDQSINEWSKRHTLRRIWESNWMDSEDIDIEIPKTSQQLMQALENELLNDWEYIEINPNDDDEQHLIEMWSLILTPEAEMHQYAHIQASIQKGQMVSEWQDQWMLNQAQAVSNSMTASEMANEI
jgi:hypothetical protein